LPNYQLTNSKINLGPEWKISENFKHKNEFVDSNDNLVSKDHSGRCYELIKYTRSFSNLKKFTRKIGAALLTICSLGGVFLSPSLKKMKIDLLEKEYESKRFKVLTSFSDLSMICPDIMHSILSYLNPVELEKCLLVSRQWQKSADQENLWNNFSYPNCTFGQEQWDQYFGLKVSANSPIPRNLIKLLESPCIVSKGKKIKDTHLLVHIPKTANDNPFNFEMFSHDEYLKERDYLFLDYGVCLDKTYESHWVLMSKNIKILKNNTYLTTAVSDKYKIRLSSLPKKFKLNNSAPNILDDIMNLSQKSI
jgi:F-box-like